jgi:hypothetical protein
MIIIDNNILSTFAKIGRLDILFRLFPQRQIAIVPAVYDDLCPVRHALYPMTWSNLSAFIICPLCENSYSTEP